MFVDVLMPVCGKIVGKEAEKITKYRDLEFEVQKCWDLSSIRTVPMIVCGLGIVSKNIKKYIELFLKNTKVSII